eukprot:TRINITY_DN4174_c0_g2_i1.p1 TRINITY_DN4174_c0_g2~~TRINITY_DN4174_c0_g2_i1.p1  ORF type:complete len:410 (-),score=101.77 TRINITY_DN4174_c0_g2_i1:348-1487(-)
MNVQSVGVVIEDLDIKLMGETSWIYTWLAETFADGVRAAVEAALTKAMTKAAVKLDTYLQGLPREIPVDSLAAIDATIVTDPVVQASSLSVAPLGQFISITRQGTEADAAPPIMPDGLSCGNSDKMLAIALSDFVINSAADVYFNAGVMKLVVDHLPDSSIIKLNTRSWRMLLPVLYRKYPDKPMVLIFNATSQPRLELMADGLLATVAADLIVSVVADGEKVTDVVVLAVSLTCEGYVGVRETNITAVMDLNDVSLRLKWSDIGNFPMKVIQTAVKSLAKNIIIPALNVRLKLGFPIPLIPGVMLREPAVGYGSNYILVCTDVEYVGGLFSLPPLAAGTATAVDEDGGRGWAVFRGGATSARGRRVSKTISSVRRMFG